MQDTHHRTNLQSERSRGRRNTCDTPSRNSRKSSTCRNHRPCHTSHILRCQGMPLQRFPPRTFPCRQTDGAEWRGGTRERDGTASLPFHPHRTDRNNERVRFLYRSKLGDYVNGPDLQWSKCRLYDDPSRAYNCESDKRQRWLGVGVRPASRHRTVWARPPRRNREDATERWSFSAVPFWEA